MTNVEKLKHLGILDGIRQRLGGFNHKGEDWDRIDAKINQMSNSTLIAKHSGWILGDEAWWSDFKHMFDELEQLDKEDNNG